MSLHLDLDVDAKRVFTNEGAEVDSVSLISDGMKLLVSEEASIPLDRVIERAIQVAQGLHDNKQPLAPPPISNKNNNNKNEKEKVEKEKEKEKNPDKGGSATTSTTPTTPTTKGGSGGSSGGSSNAKAEAALEEFAIKVIPLQVFHIFFLSLLFSFLFSLFYL